MVNSGYSSLSGYIYGCFHFKNGLIFSKQRFCRSRRVAEDTFIVTFMVTLFYRTLPSGHKRAYLDYYIQGKRYRDKLPVILRTGDKLANAEKKRLAEAMRAEKEIELGYDESGILSSDQKRITLTDYWERFNKNYKKKNYRMFNAALIRWQDFHPQGVRLSDVTLQLLTRFRDYLGHEMNGETPADYFKALRRVLSEAVRERLIKYNPATEVKNTRVTASEISKDILLPDEISLLYHTPCGNGIVKRAFLFATQTGLRKVDIKAITWSMVRNRTLTVRQSKTDRRNIIPLNENAVMLMGAEGSGQEKIFPITVSDTAVNKVLNTWVKKAGIKKHITFHCARHSHGTNILSVTGNLKLTSSLLGHTSTKYTERYTRVLDDMKKEAVGKLAKL